jgi:hypothetical protein
MPDFDVIVCGAGPSGVCAAIEAARSGAKTLLLERYGFAGGASTSALIYPWMSFHANNGEQVIGGMAQEIVDRLVERKASPGHLRDTIGFAWSVTPFDSEAYKILIDEMLLEAGVKVMYHTQVTGVRRDGLKIKELTLMEKEGPQKVSAKVVIDATGDADVSYLAGAEYIVGRRSDGLTQPLTMNFVMAGVDLEQVKAYMTDHPAEFHRTSMIQQLGQIPLTGVSGFFSLWKEFGPVEIPRDRMLFFAGIHPQEVIVNTTRIVRHKATTSAGLTAAETIGRQQVQLLVKFCQERLPGFQNSYLTRMPSQVGVRESRHVLGRYTLTARDVVSARRFPDAIARSGYPLDVHDPNGDALESGEISGNQAYDIPYRCLLPPSVQNLLVSGRCISSTHTAASSARLTPSCMAIGQAAGLAAALAAQQGCPPAEVQVDELQNLLRQHGAIILP